MQYLNEKDNDKCVSDMIYYNSYTLLQLVQAPPTITTKFQRRRNSVFEEALLVNHFILILPYADNKKNCNCKH